MNTIEVIIEFDSLKKERKQIEQHIKELNARYDGLIDSCSYEIVFEYGNDIPKKVANIKNYYCPACGKNLEFISEEGFKKSVFKDSKVIRLDKLSLIGNYETLSAIRNEVIENFNLYYNCGITEEELSNKMMVVLKDKQYKHNPRLLLAKRQK